MVYFNFFRLSGPQMVVCNEGSFETNSSSCVKTGKINVLNDIKGTMHVVLKMAFHLWIRRPN